MKENNMLVFRSKKNDDYLVISKEVLFRKDLSLQAKALHCVLMALNDDTWELTLSGLSKLSKNGLTATSNALKELEELGYLEKEQVRDKKGVIRGYNYVAYETLDLAKQPESGYPETGYPNMGYPFMGNQRLLNTNILNTNILNTNSAAEKTGIHHQVVDYLNQRTGKNFKAETKATQKLINGRVNDGYGLEDFKKVIDNKVEEWKGDSRMEKYLRPTTLFSPSNFESYLNQEVKEKDLTKELLYGSIKSGGRLF